MRNTLECLNGAATVTASRGAVETVRVSANRQSRHDESHTMECFAASVVHDLRNPLAAICGCAEILLDANLDREQTRRITTNIHRAANRMSDLLAEFAFVTRENVESAESCNLRAMLAASCEAAGLAERDGIEILLNVPAQIEAPVVRTRMTRVFVNLIVNALEAMPSAGTIRITAMEDGDFVLIEVEDNGPGIPAEIDSRLFEPFVTAGKKKGLGLGLTLARQTVRDHGGELWAEPADGARFVISLPLKPGVLQSLTPYS